MPRASKLIASQIPVPGAHAYPLLYCHVYYLSVLRVLQSQLPWSPLSLVYDESIKNTSNDIFVFYTPHVTYAVMAMLQCGAVITRYIFSKILTKTPHTSPVRSRCGVSFVSLKSDLYSALIDAVVWEMSCYIGSRYNGTWMYYVMMQSMTWANSVWFTYSLGTRSMLCHYLNDIWLIINWICTKMSETLTLSTGFSLNIQIVPPPPPPHTHTHKH